MKYETKARLALWALRQPIIWRLAVLWAAEQQHIEGNCVPCAAQARLKQWAHVIETNLRRVPFCSVCGRLFANNSKYAATLLDCPGKLRLRHRLAVTARPVVNMARAFWE